MWLNGLAIFLFMDFSELKEKYAQYYIPILLGLLGFVFLLYGLIASVIPKHDQKGDILFEAASDSVVKNSDKNIAVDIEGAVIS